MTTNIEGKYRKTDIPGGDYLIFAQFSSIRSLAEWCDKLTIEKSGELEREFHNATAVYIINKINSD